MLISLISVSYYLSVNNTLLLLLTPQTVTVSPKWVNQAQFAGFFTGIEQGIYRNNGIKLVVKEFDFESSQIDNLLSGTTDFALLSAEEFLTYVDEGKNIIAIGTIYQVSPFSLVSLQSNNIKSPADFRNKILGNKGGKLEIDLFYKALMNSVGLQVTDANFLNVGFENTELEDLKQGKVDVIDLYRTDQLYFFDKEGIEYNIISPEQFGLNTFNDVIVTRLDIIEDNPELVARFMTSTIESWELAIENPEQAVNDSLKHTTSKLYNDFDYQMYILTKSIPLIKPDSSTMIGSMKLEKWTHLYKNMLSKGLVGSDVKVEEIFTTRFLQ